MTVAATEGHSSSKLKQRSRKGNEHGVSFEPTRLGSVQVEGATRGSQTRTRGGKKMQSKRGGSELIGVNTAHSDVFSGTFKNCRPRARPLNGAKSRTDIYSDAAPQPQTVSHAQSTISEAAVGGVVDSASASPPVGRVAGESPREAILRLPRKRPNTTPHGELNDTDKRRKTLDQCQTPAAEEATHSPDPDTIGKGNYSECTDRHDSHKPR
ncbi:hypothetical protein B0F90DRAFT_564497 [Multifurca ochricompacta]|uniref:Uncharacterized protein n=1 Tax=Multifurca ochricompacta TaxID=376703 RepID=A0AAD4QSX6_9AGAM|nr:hypothetical protein B0F90DRAFT_564497 [Multifurca ochricompacta]